VPNGSPAHPDQKPLDIARAAIDYARKHYFDVLLVDTAGRLAIDEALMQEIRELHAELKPVETLFVVDAMQGQDAANTAKAFKEALPLTGIILTKTDGDSRGGAALSVRQITGAPIKFAGTSEKIDGLEVFDAERHAGRILGMGDIVALVEQVTAGVDMAAAQKLAEKVKSGAGFAGFVVPALGVQRAVHQQVGVVLFQLLFCSRASRSTTGAHSTRSAVTRGSCV
jgi:signal recognition particle subunit SRP54